MCLFTGCIIVLRGHAWSTGCHAASERSMHNAVHALGVRSRSINLSASRHATHVDAATVHRSAPKRAGERVSHMGNSLERVQEFRSYPVHVPLMNPRRPDSAFSQDFSRPQPRCETRDCFCASAIQRTRWSVMDRRPCLPMI